VPMINGERSMFKISITVANGAQARAYQGRIEDQVLTPKALSDGSESVGYVFLSRDNVEVVIKVSTPERLVQVVQKLYIEEYI